jgi:hypothetical protein
VLADKRMPLTVFETGAAERFNAMTRVPQERVPATGCEEVDARDQLVDVRKCGLEANTVCGLVAAGELPVRKMGPDFRTCLP